MKKKKTEKAKVDEKMTVEEMERKTKELELQLAMDRAAHEHEMMAEELKKAKNEAKEAGRHKPTVEEAKISQAKADRFCTFVKGISSVVVGVTGVISIAYGVKATSLEINKIKAEQDRIEALTD